MYGEVEVRSGVGVEVKGQMQGEVEVRSRVGVEIKGQMQGEVVVRSRVGAEVKGQMQGAALLFIKVVTLCSWLIIYYSNTIQYIYELPPSTTIYIVTMVTW